MKYQIQKDNQTNTIILVEDVETDFNPIVLDTDPKDINFWSPKTGLYIQDTEFTVDEVEIGEELYNLVAKPN